MGAMEIGGLLNARHAAADAQFQYQLHQQSMHMNAHPFAMNHSPPMAHPHPHHHHQHSISQPTPMTYGMSPSQHHQMMAGGFLSQHSNVGNSAQLDSNEIRPRSEPAPKAFNCSTCNKAFARRSDLARHERIHSGVRPHACDFPGCGKQFIQRSALTVHARVHTGEKPHMCERCGKPFSDSSSLARHRRIHSGKRPYKCPYANCQKTFTRRTTLTRHQNHHTGTVEQAQAETNAKLSMTNPTTQAQPINNNYSDAVSPHSIESPAHTLSMSPPEEIVMQTMPKQNSDFQFMQQTSQALPPHMRADYHAAVSRTTQALSSPSVSGYADSPQVRLAMVAHPTGFGSGRPLEPSARGGNNGVDSPHISTMGWVSPGHAGMTASSVMDPYTYQESAYGGQALYYPGSNLRRPQSTEPEDYGMRPTRAISHHMATGNMHMAPDWTIPMSIQHEIKPERGFV